ncbi:calcium-binding protein [[Phormidium] sp. ETS-05]|uniref:beta strand repeat-containing protein n=1 Tax=[Phormidium] sp. ETS-05 TaxID=222819 RepID=UPI0018EF1723|nr:calcium-binding protein [[Phormidium] sp. ETS-05]
MVRILTTGDDTLDMSATNAGPDSIFGLDGTDFITSDTVGGSLISGNRDNDSLTSSGTNDTVFGGQDNDVLRSLAGNSLFFGDFGDDYFESRGTLGGDIVYGLGDDDIFNFGNGGGGNLAFGNTGTDFISGSGLGDDTLFGGMDNDTLQVVELSGSGSSGTGGFVPFNTPISSLGVSTTQGLSGTGSVGVVTTQGVFGPPTNPGDNYLSGDKGNDLVIGIGDRDTLLGGEDNDTLMMLSALSSPGNQNTSLQGATNANTFTLAGVPRANFLDGGIGDDSLHSEGGDRGRHTLIGGDGKDTMTYIGVDSYLLGGTGDDSLTLDEANNTGIGRNTLYGGQGNDTIFTEVGGGTNWLYGDKGNDSLIGSSGDTLFGGTKDGDEDAATDNDYLSITAAGRSWMDGGKGSDTLIGSGTATLVGGAGDDSLDVGVNNNASLLGGEGNDTLTARGTGSTLNGGAGNDTLTLTPFGNTSLGVASSNTLLGGEGNDSLFALSAGGPNYLDGGTGNDILVAGHSSDTLIGGGGNDLFVGSSEADTLGGESGRSGNDTLYGFKGADLLIGIDGSFDGFYYNGSDQGDDTITDFDTGIDKIYIDDTGFALATQGQQLRSGLDFFAVASGQNYTGTFSGGTTIPAIVFDSAATGGGTLYWDYNGGLNPDGTDSVIAVIQQGQVNVNDIVIF